MQRLREFLRGAAWLRPLRLARLRRIARTEGHEDWPALIGADLPRWEAARAAAVGGPRVLIATNLGGHFTLNAIDRLLAIALTLRGAEVRIALCDRWLAACQMAEANLYRDRGRFAAHGPRLDQCDYCYAPSHDAFAALGLPVIGLGALLSPAARAALAQGDTMPPLTDLSAWQEHDLPLGEHALAGTLRFFARGDLGEEPSAEAVARRYFIAARQTAAAYRRLLDEFPADVVVAHHGIYVPQGVAVAVARQSGRRVVVWNPAYRRHCLMFSHTDTYHHTMMTEPTTSWRHSEFGTEAAMMIEEYLRSRWEGDRDWIRFHRDPDYGLSASTALRGLDFSKPTVLALTNVFWDAQLHYPTNAFRSQLEWLRLTIEWFIPRTSLQLIIRVHPAEITGTPASRQFAATEIAKLFPQLPDHIRIVPPDSALSTYAIAERCDSAIIYATKTGVELSAMGIPVIVAGEAWVRNKGFTHDVQSVEHYVELLGRLPFGARLAPEMIALARRYAFHFFFRRMIPLDFVAPMSGPRRFATRIAGLALLQPGAHTGLDTICNGILLGSPFHMPTAAALALGKAA